MADDDEEEVRYLVGDNADEPGEFYAQVDEEGRLAYLVSTSGETIYALVEGQPVHQDHLVGELIEDDGDDTTLH